jgi:hypothetical protein
LSSHSPAYNAQHDSWHARYDTTRHALQVFMLANFEIEHAYNWEDWTWTMEYGEFVEAAVRLCVLHANMPEQQAADSTQAAPPIAP